MLTKRMEEQLNKQIVAELYSAYLYLAMSAFCHAKKMPGMGHWMKKQAQEEDSHAMKIFDYVAENGRVRLTAIEAPPAEWDSPLAVAEGVLAHEKKVTAMIHALAQTAKEEKDPATQEFLVWFIEEQEEEEESAGSLVEMLRGAKDAQALAQVDAELGRR